MLGVLWIEPLPVPFFSCPFRNVLKDGVRQHLEVGICAAYQRLAVLAGAGH